jgi:hypothetical protein
MNAAAAGDWVDAALDATTEVASQALGFEAVVPSGQPGAAFDSPYGAYVPLTSGEDVLQLGLVAERAGCETISRALLCMAPDDAFSAESDIADAVGEIANMVAGGVKKRMDDRVPGILLGLPLFVSGGVEPHGADRSVSEVRIGDVRAQVVVLWTRGGRPAPASRRSR